MNVINLFSGMKYISNPKERYSSWYNFMEKDPEIRSRCINDHYEYNKEITDNNIHDFAFRYGLDYDDLTFEEMIKTEHKLTKIINKIDISDYIDSSEISIVLYHGLGNSAGWATTYKNKPAVLLGIEKIVELNWTSENDLENLVFHELLHIIHQVIRLQNNQNDFELLEEGLNRFYIEGFATYFEQILSGKQRRKVWINDCETIEFKLKTSLQKQIQTTKEYRMYFGDWWQVEGISDTGYFIGYKIIKELHKTMTLKEIALLTTIDFEKYLQSYLMK